MKIAHCGRIGRRVSLMLALAVSLSVAGAADAQTILFENARIVPVSSKDIKKGSVLVKDGKIVRVAESLEAPFDAKVIDCTGKTLFPGMVDPHTWRGMDVPNESPPVTPFVNVYDAIDPSQLFFEDSLRDGVTSIHIIAANDCVIGGMSRVVHPIGMTPEEMTTAGQVALKLCISPKNGFDRMLQMATFRETFAKLDESMKSLAEKRYEDKLREEGKDLDVPPEEEQKRGRELIRDEDVDEKDRNLLWLTQGKIRAFIYCGKAMDVRPAIALAKKHGFYEQTVLVLGSECFKATDELKDARRPVVLDANLVHREKDPITGEEKETFVPRQMDRAGLKFALQRQASSSLGDRYLWYQAARCVAEGVSRDKALKSITLWPAEMLGLGERLGSIESGKDANILVLTGDPLDAQTWVEHVYVQGEHVYDREEDIRLKKLFAKPAEEAGPSTSESAPADEEKAAEGDSKPELKNADDQPRQDQPRRPGEGRRGGRRGPGGGPRPGPRGGE